MKNVLRVPRVEVRASIRGNSSEQFLSRKENVLHGGSVAEALAETQVNNFSRVRTVLHGESVVEAFAEAQVKNFSRIRNVLHGESVVEAFAEAHVNNFSRVRNVLHRGNVAELPRKRCGSFHGRSSYVRPNWKE